MNITSQRLLFSGPFDQRGQRVGNQFNVAGNSSSGNAPNPFNQTGQKLSSLPPLPLYTNITS